MKIIFSKFFYNPLKFFKKGRKALILVILVLFVLSSLRFWGFLFPKQAEAAWFDDTYAYRVKFTFTHNADISSERAVTFTLDTAELIAANLMQADCDDTRFTSANGKPLLYDLTGICNNAATTYEVIFPSIVNGSNLAYVYYSNPGAVNAEINSAGYTALTPSGGDPSETAPTTNDEQGTSPISYWNLDEGYGTTANDNSTGSNNDLTITNAVWRTEDLCLFGKCLVFDGNADYATKTYSSDTELLPGTASFTVSGWFKHTSTAGADTLISRADAVAGVGWKVYMNSSGYMCFGIDDTAGTFPADSACGSTSLADSQWHYITAVKSGTSTITLFIDGRQITQTAVTATLTLNGTNAPFTVGNDFDNGTNGWDGFIDEVKYYNFARSAANIQTEFASRGTVKGSSAQFGNPDLGKTLSNGLVGYWKMDETGWTNDCVTEDVADSSGNLNHGESCPGATGPDPAVGKFANAGSFDNTDDYVGVDDANSLDFSSDFTASLWFSPNETFSITSDNVRGMLDKGAYRMFLDKSDGKLKGEVNNGASTWTSFYAGSQDLLISLGVYNGKLYAGQGGVAGAGDVLVYDGTSWTTSYDGSTNWVMSMAVYNGKLYVGLGNAGGFGDILEFDGASWTTSYNGATSGVYSLAVYNNKLYASTGGSAGQGDVLVYDGSWTTSYDGATTTVRSLAVYNGKLYAGRGGATGEGDVLVLDGSWSTSYDGGQENIRSLAVYNNKLYAGQGENAFDGDVYVFDGSTWSLSFNTTHRTTSSLTVYNNKLYAGHGDNVNNGDISNFDGTTWSTTEIGANYEQVFALTVFEGKLYAGFGSNANESDVWVLDAGGQISSTTTSWPQSTWQHAVLTKSGRTLSLYVNGTLQSQTSLSSATVATNTFSLFLGKLYGTRGTGTGDGMFKGSIDEVRFYNRALSGNEAQALYNWAPGPVGWWKFDDNTGGSVTDSSGGSTTGTWNGTGTHWSPGKIGSAGKFNGTDDYVVTSNLSPAVTTFTYEAWIRPNFSSSDTNDHTIIDWQLTAGDSDRLYLRWENNTSGFYADSKGNFAYSALPSFSANTWHHIVFTRGATNTGQFYWDGAAITTTKVLDAGGIDNTANMPVYIGDDIIDSAAKWDGLIDDVLIYNYVRTQKQIIEDMNAGHPAPGSPISSQTIYWSMDEQQGGTANNSGIDETLDGTATGTTWLLENNCKVNGCINIDTATDDITKTDPAFFDSLTGMAASFWLNPQTLATTNAIISKSNTSQETFLIQTDATNSDELRIYIADTLTDTANYFTTTNLDLTASTWYHIVVVYDATAAAADRVKVYKNGRLATGSVTGTIPSDGLTASSANFQVGESHKATAGLLSYIDEVKIYNFPLTGSEVLIDANAGSSSALGGVLGTHDSEGFAGNPPVGEWKLDENTGTTANDTSGNGNTGTLAGGTTWARGKVGSAIDFNGSTGIVSTSITTHPTSFTVEAWANADVSDGTFDTVISKFTDSPSYNGFFLRHKSGNINASVYNAGTEYTSITTITAGGWNHWAMTFVGSTIKLYKNGVLADSDAGTMGSNSTALTIGGNYGAAFEPFDGKIDQVRYFNYARTPAQIAYDYNRGAPVAQWDFDECQGSTAYDNSTLGSGAAGGKNGTITIGATGTQTAVGTCTTASTAWGNGVTGKFNSSLNFDGTDDFVTAGTNPITGTSPFTLSAWMKMGSHSDYGLGAYIGTATSGQSAWIGWTALAQVGTSNTIGGGFYGRNYGSGVNDSNWHHVVLSFSGGSSGTALLYVDGIQKVNDTYTPNLASTSIMMGKANTATAYWYNGQIDDARIYNYALTPTQIQRLFNEGSAVRFGPLTGSP